MKIGKILIAAIALSIFGVIFGTATCGGVFNWVYKLEPTNVWKPMDGPPGVDHLIVGFILNIVLAAVYALFRKGIPGKNRLVKGFVFGLCVWAVGMLPGMFATYYFMTVATAVIVYWTILSLVEYPIMGLIIAAIYGE
jgi:hypothetical protein